MPAVSIREGSRASRMIPAAITTPFRESSGAVIASTKPGSQTQSSFTSTSASPVASRAAMLTARE